MNDPENIRVLGCPKINESAPPWVRMNNLECSDKDVNQSNPEPKCLFRSRIVERSGLRMRIYEMRSVPIE